MKLATLFTIGSVTLGSIGTAYEGAKTAAPYLQNPPPFPNETQVAQALQAIQKGQSIANDRLSRIERHQVHSDLDLNAIKMSLKATQIDSLKVEVRMHPSDPTLHNLLKDSEQELGDLQIEHDALRKAK